MNGAMHLFWIIPSIVLWAILTHRDIKNTRASYKNPVEMFHCAEQERLVIYDGILYVHTPNAGQLGNYMRKDLWDLATACGDIAEQTWYSSLPEQQVKWICNNG